MAAVAGSGRCGDLGEKSVREREAEGGAAPKGMTEYSFHSLRGVYLEADDMQRMNAMKSTQSGKVI